MAKVSKSFTDVGVGDPIVVRDGESFTYTLSGTYAQTDHVEKSEDGGDTYEIVAGPFSTPNATVTGTIQHKSKSQKSALFRWRCTADTSGTGVTVIKTKARAKSEIRIQNGHGKAGATAGFVLDAATNVGRMATCPADKTAATFVLPLDNLKAGEVIEGYHLLGQIESAGGTVTVDASIRKITPAAADVTDAAVTNSGMTQVSKTADAVLNEDNTLTEGFEELVDSAYTYYMLITVTTGSSCDIDLLGVALRVRPVQQ